MFQTILLATDGSPASTEAARVAIELAGVHRSRLVVLSVIDPYPYVGVGEASATGFQAYMASAYEHAARAHAQVTELCASMHSSADLQLRRVEDTSAAEGILQAAEGEGAGLIVVGSHGRSGLQRLMVGSVAARVVATSSLPVLVVRQRSTG